MDKALAVIIFMDSMNIIDRCGMEVDDGSLDSSSPVPAQQHLNLALMIP